MFENICDGLCFEPVESILAKVLVVCQEHDGLVPEVFFRLVVIEASDALHGLPGVYAADDTVIYPGEGGSQGCAVYGCLFVGKGAYGVVDLNDGTEVIVKPRGSSGTADPLDQRSSVGWKGVHAAAILYDEYIVRVECGSSYSGQDKAN